MPVGGFNKETYEKNGTQLNHFTETLSYKKPKKILKKKLPFYTNFNLEINELDSLFKTQIFIFKIDSSLISKMKNDTFSKNYYQVRDFDIDKYLGQKKNIELSLLDIQSDTLDNYTVYDGRPFAFNLVFKKDIQDTIEVNYFGNLNDGIKSKDIKNWLPLYILINKYKLFKTNDSVISFFDNNHFMTVLFRFLKWQIR